MSVAEYAMWWAVFALALIVYLPVVYICLMGIREILADLMSPKGGE